MLSFYMGATDMNSGPCGMILMETTITKDHRADEMVLSNCL